MAAAEEFEAWVTKVVGESWYCVGTLRLYAIERTVFRAPCVSHGTPLKDRVLCFNQQVAKMAIPPLWDQATYSYAKHVRPTDIRQVST